TATLLAEVAGDSGLPAGVLNIIHGTGVSAGTPLTTHPEVRAISFTGGTTTGATIAQATAGSFKRLALEMGGKNPNIVFSDGDLDEVLPTSIRSSFSNQGQICLCGSRIFVERACYDQFVDRFVALAENLKIGDPLEAETEFGALVSQAQLDKVEYYVSLAKDEGGSIVCGGARPEPINQRCADGYFYLPTVITGLPVECRVNQEEVFGPVVTITSFDDEDEVVGYANSTRYGLAASIWTADLARAHRVAAQVESGIIWINCWMLRDLRVPFGGMKDSGLGREGGGEALRFFTEPKSICVSLKS
ncbi:MAG: aldehyde dehydrogenase family protein, partial [Gemmatimonadales bacterium]